jgi:predicted DNA-binding ribbon-helix-helix protein
MYSPKIDENLIQKLYRIARAKKMPMTRLVNNILKKEIKDIKLIKVIEQKPEMAERETWQIA